jgi:hypothetical protein
MSNHPAGGLARPVAVVTAKSVPSLSTAPHQRFTARLSSGNPRETSASQPYVVGPLFRVGRLTHLLDLRAVPATPEASGPAGAALTK